jgi:hypothetical protein
MGKWQIGESGTAFALDPQGQGEVTFTVTNASTAPDRAVLKVNPLDGAADGWFTVTEPMRSVAAGASVVFPVALTVPQSVAAGTYGLQGVAYSADTDPSETSATSKRVSVTVGTAAAAPKKGLPWWVFAVIGAAVLLVLIVLAVLLLGGGDDEGASTSNETTTTTEATTTTTAASGSGTAGGGIFRPTPRDVFLPLPTTTTAPPPERITVPNAIGLFRDFAIERLDGDFEVAVEVDCTQPAASLFPPIVVDQTPQEGRVRDKGSTVTIVVQPVPGDSACI